MYMKVGRGHAKLVRALGVFLYDFICMIWMMLHDIGVLYSQIVTIDRYEADLPLFLWPLKAPGIYYINLYTCSYLVYAIWDYVQHNQRGCVV